MLALVQPPRHRTRQQSYVLAHEAAQQQSLTYENAWGSMAAIRRWAYVYRQAVSDKEIVLVSDDQQVKVLPYLTRFSVDYGAEQSSRLYRLLKQSPASVMITLTLDPSKVHSLSAAYTLITKSVSKLIHAARQARSRANSPFKYWTGQYIKVVELQKNGSPHVHLTLEGCRWVDLDWIRSLWEKKYHVGTFIRVSRLYNGVGMANYLSKYLAKTHARRSKPFEHLTSVEETVSDTLMGLWALNARAFTTSIHLFLIKSIEQLAQKAVRWFYAGAFRIGQITTYVDLMAAVGGNG